MTERQQRYALDATKELVAAKLSNSTLRVCEEGGKEVADFIEAIYNKFVELQIREDIGT